MSYRIDLFDASGNRQAILQEDILASATLDLSLSSAPTLTISMPLSEDKSSFISSLYDARIYNTNSGAYEHSLFRLYNTEIVDSDSGLQISAEYQGILTRLSDEFIDSYDTGSAGDTFADVINDLLAFQVNTPAINVGTLEPTPTVAIAMESTDIYSALNSIRDAFGGWFEVDTDLSLNWHNDNTGDPYREIRRSKNLKSLNYTPKYSKIVNRVYAYGKGEGEARLNLTDAGEIHEYIDDTESQALYGIRAKKYIDKRITHPATLLRYAQRILDEYKNPPYQYTVDVLNLAEVSGYDYSLESLSLDTRIRVIDDLLGVDVDTSIISISLDLLAPENIEIELSTVRNDISDMFGDIRRTQDIANSVATQIGVGQVTVQGTFVVEDWVTSGSTTIDGGNITTGTITATEIAANTITTNELNFTPTNESNIIGTINASSEGIEISANKITLAGVVETTNNIQSSNYSPGSAGWIIDGNGNAEFNTITIYGGFLQPGDAAYDVNSHGTTIGGDHITTNTLSVNTIKSSSMTYGQTITIGGGGGGTLQSANYSPGSTGWIIDGNGNAEFNTITIYGGFLQPGDAAEDVNNNPTEIYGGKILTSTITANEIATRTITANEISVGTITAYEIAANTITVNELNFTPSTTSTVVWTINNSTEGITINADKITLAGTVQTTDNIQSYNYYSGLDGWIIRGNGDAELNNVVVRGTVYATGGEFTGTISSTGLSGGKIVGTTFQTASTSQERVVIDSDGIRGYNIVNQLHGFYTDTSTTLAEMKIYDSGNEMMTIWGYAGISNYDSYIKAEYSDLHIACDSGYTIYMGRQNYGTINFSECYAVSGLNTNSALSVHDHGLTYFSGDGYNWVRVYNNSGGYKEVNVLPVQLSHSHLVKKL